MDWLNKNLIDVIKLKRAALLTLVLSFGLGWISHILFMDALTDRGAFWRIQEWWMTVPENRGPLPGLFFAILAGAVFVYGIYRLAMPGANFDFVPQENPPRAPRFGFWLTSLGLSILAASAVTYTSGVRPNGYFALILWLVAVVLVVVSVLISENWRPPSLGQISAWVKENRNELLVVNLIVAAAFVIRTYNLELYPYSFVNDEGEMGKAGLCILRGNCSNFFQMAWAAQPLIAMIPDAISIGIFGITAFAVRFPMAVLGTLAVLGTYLFAREVFDRRIAWISAALMATLPVHVHFSRLGVDNLIDSFFSSTLIWLLYRGAKHNDRVAYMAAGVLGGLTLYTYPGSRLSLALGLGSLIYLCMRTKNYLRAHIDHIAIFFLVLVVTMTPMAAHFIQHPENFMARLNAEGIFTNGIVENESKQPDQSVTTVVIKQFLRSSLVYIATPGDDGFYMGQRSYLAPLAGILFILGLALVATKLGDPRYMTLFAWFWAAVILGSTMTAAPPSSERMMNSMPALAIITAIGLVKSAEIFESLGSFARRATPVLLIAAVLLTNFQDYRFYFVEYAQKHSWENTTNELTYESRLEIQPLGDQGRFYLIGDPLVYIVFANFTLFSPDVQKADLKTITPETLAALPKDKDALFIAIPYRKGDLQNLASWIPGGTWKEVHRRYQPDQVLYYSYKVTKDQLASFKP